MAGATGSQDQSMEEILQSIKRIIAEEGDESAPSDDINPLATSNSVAGSDILELTDFVDELPEEAQEEVMPTADDFMALDDMLNDTQKPEPEPEIQEPEEMSFAAQDVDVTSILTMSDSFEEEEHENLSTADVLSDIDTLLSDDTARSASSAFKELAALKQKTPAPHHVDDKLALRSGTTVEDLTLELLRPLMKQWLDANLPDMVERLVQQEIKRLTNASE